MDKDRFLCGAVSRGASVKMTAAVSHLSFLPKNWPWISKGSMNDGEINGMILPGLISCGMYNKNIRERV